MCLLGKKFRAGNPPFILISVRFVLLFIRDDLNDCFHVFYWLPESKSELCFLCSYGQLKTCHSMSNLFAFSIYKTLLLCLLLLLEVNVVCHVALQSCNAAVWRQNQCWTACPLEGFLRGAFFLMQSCKLFCRIVLPLQGSNAIYLRDPLPHPSWGSLSNFLTSVLNN